MKFYELKTICEKGTVDIYDLIESPQFDAKFVAKVLNDYVNMYHAVLRALEGVRIDGPVGIVLLESKARAEEILME